MNIQNNNINFEARRIVNVRRAVQGRADEVIDIFALGRNDKKFMSRCNAALQETDRIASAANTKNNRGFKMFFRDFITRLSGNQKAFPFDDTYAFIAIRNGEEIAGIAEVDELSFPKTRLNKVICPKKDKLTLDGLVYGVLSALRGMFNDEGRRALVSYDYDFPSANEMRELEPRLFKLSQKFICSGNKNTKFTEVKDPHEYDLEDFLGIKDIETEIM